ncbi:MAG: RNA polymerase sigma factor [Oscillospiraceae bacterium]|nr:RNA polymerase sigma factor [Oscillospiraceae bacterium]
MANSLLRTDREIAELYERHKEKIYRVCFLHMKNAADTEDAVHDTFCKLIQSGTVFNDSTHEEAWLIRTAGNLCKDNLRHWWRKRENLEDYNHLSGQSDIDHTLSVVLDLPSKYKTVIYLYYYEGYDSVEISKILQKPQSTIRYYLSQARKILKEQLGGTFHDEQQSLGFSEQN